MADAPPPLDDDLVRELGALAADLAQRLDHADLARKVEWLVDTLIPRG